MIAYSYSKRTPPKDKASIRQGEAAAVARGNLDELRARGELRLRNLRRGRLKRVQVPILRIRIRVHVAESTVPCCVSSEGTVIVNAPSYDLVVLRKRDGMHATASKLDDMEIGGIVSTKPWVLARLEGCCALRTKAKFAAFAASKDENREDLGGSLIDDREGVLGGRLWSWCYGGRL